MILPKYNDTYGHTQHYVSYNFADRSIYGSDTTAIVIGQMQRFYILNGNHVEALKGKDFTQCMEYFLNHQNLHNSRGDKYDPEDALKVISDYEAFQNKNKKG